MKWTCSALSRFSASSSARAGWPSRPRAAGLLVVGLERRRRAGVDDGPDVRLVDAHAERVGGDDHAHVVGEEAALDVGARLAVEAGVVGERLLAERLGQLLGDLLGPRARARVDDRRQRVRLRQRLRDQRPLLVAAGAGDDERDVRPVEAGRHLDRIVAGRAGARCRARRAASPWRSRRRSSRRRDSAPRRRDGSSRGGSRGPTARRSAPRRRRTARSARPASPRGSPARRTARARRRAGCRSPPAARAQRLGVRGRVRCALTSATRSPSPRAWSASTWSCISATSGDTTIVRSSRISAGSW